MSVRSKSLSIPEFVGLLALMGSIVALSIDAMLPALGEIGVDLRVGDPNEVQFVVTTLMFGLASGQIIAGPLSDSLGRKPVIYAGYVVFITGCLFSMLASSFGVMLAGRFLQGLGAAAPRTVSIALVRDGYQGRAMARIMSIVSAIFIFVPALAPSIGQGVLLVMHWRAIFGILLAAAALAFIWFAWRQPETLPPASRRPFSLRSIGAGIRDILSRRAVIGYTAATGIMFGAFLGYLSSAQQVFQTAYATGRWFSLYFGCAALAIGAASAFNARMVMRRGMQYITWRALAGLTCVSFLFIPTVMYCEGLPPFWAFMSWLLVSFFCTGTVFGNFNAMAMEPIGHVAGLGAAVVGSVSTFMSLPIGWAIGASFDGTILPLVSGFALAGGLCMAIMWRTERHAPPS